MANTIAFIRVRGRGFIDWLGILVCFVQIEFLLGFSGSVGNGNSVEAQICAVPVSEFGRNAPEVLPYTLLDQGPIGRSTFEIRTVTFPIS